MADADRCVMCGAIIPEGRMVCPTCEKEKPLNRDAETIGGWSMTADDCPPDCRWHGRYQRYQRCPCCRRNPSLKDYYESRNRRESNNIDSGAFFRD